MLNRTRMGTHQTSNWNPSEIIKEEYYLLVPFKIKKGLREIKIGLYNEEGRLSVYQINRPIENFVTMGTIRII